MNLLKGQTTNHNTKILKMRNNSFFDEWISTTPKFFKKKLGTGNTHHYSLSTSTSTFCILSKCNTEWKTGKRFLK